MYRFATIQNVTDDRQTDDTLYKGATDSTFGQKTEQHITHLGQMSFCS